MTPDFVRITPIYSSNPGETGNLALRSGTTVTFILFRGPVSANIL